MGYALKKERKSMPRGMRKMDMCPANKTMGTSMPVKK
jgi:hypothetical protein